VVSSAAGVEHGSRRELLKAVGAGFAAGGGALLVAACGGSHPVTTQTTTAVQPVPGADVALLNHLLDLEHVGIAAYTAGIPLLDPAARMAGQRFLNQELAHAGELSGLVSQAGGQANKSASSYSLGHPRNGNDVLKLLHRIEHAQISAYLGAIPKLSTPSTRAAVAAMLANDAQHISYLRTQLGRQPIPAALLNGRE
jgi:bacterioferritin (cytochrome b1)